MFSMSCLSLILFINLIHVSVVRNQVKLLDLSQLLLQLVKPISALGCHNQKCAESVDTNNTLTINQTLSAMKDKCSLEEYANLNLSKPDQQNLEDISKMQRINYFVHFSKSSFNYLLKELSDLPYRLLNGELIPLPSGDLIVDIHRIMSVNHFLARKYEQFSDFIFEKFSGGVLDETVIRDYVVDKPFLKYFVSRTCFEKVGCFYTENSVDFINRWIAFQPLSPKQINMTFTVFNSTNPNIREVFGFDPDSDDDRSRIMQSFRANGTFVVFITHGYQDFYVEKNWNAELRDQLIVSELVRNVVIVDWSGGSITPFYGQAVANTKIVAVMLAYFIKKLQEYIGISLDDIHLVGHSLGAQISGLASKRFTNGKIAIITALDPAGPQFYRISNVTRIVRYDAKIVRALHTDAGVSLLEGFGLEDPVGDYDFYPNGGTHQYGCFTGASIGVRLMDALTTVSCGHHRAVDLVVDRNYRNGECYPVGYECEDFSTFLEARCAYCELEHNCRLMTIQLERPLGDAKLDVNRKYFIITDKRSPFYVYHHQLALHTSSEFNLFGISGYINITIESNQTIPFTIKIDLNNLLIESNRIYTFLLLTRHSMVRPQRIKLLIYTRKIIDRIQSISEFLPFLPSLDDFSIGFKYIELNYMSHFDKQFRLNNSRIFCPQESGILRKNSSQEYIECENQDLINNRSYSLTSDKLSPLDPKIKNIEFSTYNRAKFFIYNNTKIN